MRKKLKSWTIAASLAFPLGGGAQEVELTAEQVAVLHERTRATYEAAIVESAHQAAVVLTGIVVDIVSAHPEVPDWQAKDPPKRLARILIEQVHQSEEPFGEGEEVIVGFRAVAHAWRIEPGERFLLLLERDRRGNLRPRLSRRGTRLAAWRLGDNDVLTDLGTSRDALLARIETELLKETP